MKVFLCLFFCTFLFEAFAQPDQDENIGNKLSIFVNLNSGNGVGEYQTILKERNRLVPQFGVSGGALFNPFGAKKSFPIMVGGEIGTITYWERPITSYPGNF